jgi:outer membrane protein assembly factor BamB
MFIVVMWIVYKGPALIVPGSYWAQLGMMIGPALGFFGFVVSWLFFSRIPWRDRWLMLLACGLGAAIVYPICDESFRGLPLGFYAPPIVLTAWAVWLLITPSLAWPVRRISLAVVLGLVWCYFPLLRWNSVDGFFQANVTWRWALTDEDRFLAENSSRGSFTAPKEEKSQELQLLGVSTVALAASPWRDGPMLAAAAYVARIPKLKLELQPGDWPGFRGSNRDGRLLGTRISSDWEKNPPRELWRHRVGPGWSSCIVIGTRLYTQEQIKDNEAVVCYDTTTGNTKWIHLTPGRFSEALGGIGPRATPAFHDGRIYALGAMGPLVCLDAVTGELIWTHNIKDDADAKLPDWGFSSSPLVAEGIVMVYAGGDANKMMLGYDAVTGDLKWSAGVGRKSYCSPQPARVGGVDQFIMSSANGLAAFKPATGEALWHYDWDVGDVARCVQPALVDDNAVLLGTGFSMGTKKVTVRREGSSWNVTEDWKKQAKFSPYFNDFVVHKGHIYGFDNGVFTCIDVATGKAKWKERGGDGDNAYGFGEVLLLADQDLLLILTEANGSVCLLDAKPEYRELPGRFQALEKKTWNHPVIAHGKLFVRNAAEIVCYELNGYELTQPSVALK